MDYQEALVYLDELTTFGIRLGLTRMEELCVRLGSPERSFASIHVAGTNGKGSVTQMMAAVCQAAGIRTGRYLSPHLISYTERMSIDGRDISEEMFAALLTRVRHAADEMAAAGHEHPTQFEALTALAFLYFAEQSVEVAVIETGLGGLLDSTNVIHPMLTIITNVAMDHADRCGGTLLGIAEHKAGIIKEGVPLITAATGEPLAIIRARAEALGVDTFIHGVDFSAQMAIFAEGQRVTFHAAQQAAPASFVLALAGGYQAENAALVIMAAKLLAREDVRITEEAVGTGLRTVHHPARFEILAREPYPIVVDGAHNPAGMAALRVGLDAYFPQEPRIFLLGILKDKDIDAMLAALLRHGDQVITVRPHSERAAGADFVAAAAAAMGVDALACGDVQTGTIEAVQRAHAFGRLLVVCGSLYLVGSVRQMLMEHGR